MEQTLTPALKEWAVAVEALTQGKTILLLRKGGIREAGGGFSVAHSQVWLYPTYEHQQPHLLKPEYATLQPVVPWHPNTVSIAAYADITHIFQVSDALPLAALLPFHIWNEQFVIDRFQWKPKQPLYVLLLRVHRLHSAQTIAYRSEYGGCKSWIELLPLPTAESSPVLSNAAFDRQVRDIEAILGDRAASH